MIEDRARMQQRIEVENIVVEAVVGRMLSSISQTMSVPRVGRRATHF